jgi:hypothetical protein
MHHYGQERIYDNAYPTPVEKKATAAGAAVARREESKNA